MLSQVVKRLFLVALSLLVCAAAPAAPELEKKPEDPRFERFQPHKAPQPGGLGLKKGDRLAIIGDSITEQKQYSRMMETYLTVCVPELEVTARQYGWGGETAPGFLSRMTNDCLTFKPTIATTCYGMNDHGYRAYTPDVGERYRKASTAIVQSFKANGVRVIQGSPGSVGWTGDANAEAKNLSLCELRNLGIDLAEQEHVGFADVFWPMITAGAEAQKRYAPNYAISGGDRVHTVAAQDRDQGLERGDRIMSEDDDDVWLLGFELGQPALQRLRVRQELQAHHVADVSGHG